MGKSLRIAVLVIIAAFLAIGGYLYYTSQDSTTTEPTTSAPVSIPREVLDNKFGFLGGGPDAEGMIKKRGALWARPHPGPFLWERMQESAKASISFGETDKEVKDIQQTGLGILATLWPFADWDQESRPDAAKCKVSSEDEFLPGKGAEKGRIDYLPWYRCNPNDWAAYAAWVKAAVERYDGDGTNDMPGLKIPIKYWEVMNEPDLDGGDRLDFYNEDADAYVELLIQTAEAIKEADPEAKILVAGAAGGDDRFLNFYRTVFQNKEAVAAFDIGNVHCISNDNYDSFNVEPYKEMLQEFGINKPIWVTEAQALLSDDPDINATLTLNAVKKALALKAGRIFFTNYDFGRGKGPGPPGGGVIEIEKELDGDNAEEAYQTITDQK